MERTGLSRIVCPCSRCQDRLIFATQLICVALQWMGKGSFKLFIWFSTCPKSQINICIYTCIWCFVSFRIEDDDLIQRDVHNADLSSHDRGCVVQWWATLHITSPWNTISLFRKLGNKTRQKNNWLFSFVIFSSSFQTLFYTEQKYRLFPRLFIIFVFRAYSSPPPFCPVPAWSRLFLILLSLFVLILFWLFFRNKRKYYYLHYYE